MSAKGKGKGKGKGKAKPVDANKLTQVDRTFYELTIADLNKKLATMRSHFSKVDNSKVAVSEELRKLKEDRVDVTAHLERTLVKSSSRIRELEERLKETERVRSEENRKSSKRIHDLETGYKGMHNQLQSEIKLLNGKLNSLDEFRLHRDEMLAKFDVQEDDLREKDRQYQDKIFLMQQKTIVEKNALKKDVELKLMELSEDFTRSSEIRNAGYTRRLIRENIALQKEIDILMLANIKMQQQREDHIRQQKEMRENINSLEQMRRQLIISSHNKIQIIEKLAIRYEKVKEKYTEMAKYRKMYHTLLRRGTCEHYANNELNKKNRVLNQRIDVLKLEKNRLIALHQHHEDEIVELRHTILHIKLAVQATMDLKSGKEVESGRRPALKEDENAERVYRLQRRSLLEELLVLVSSHSRRMPDTPSVSSISQTESSIYEPGKIGFLRRINPSVTEIFKTKPRKGPTGEPLITLFHKRPDSWYIPKARKKDSRPVYDVEMGSTLYVSSSGDDNLEVHVEEELLEAGEEGTSSDNELGASAHQSKASLTTASPAQTVPPESAKTTQPHTGEESAGDATTTDNYRSWEDEAEEENSINLFY